ncbi:hypothetical protein [Pseudoalteromonas obscura]|uniref:Uncharacterized protein n=1 Tax=Pseudoalteromonas obscura TaxID=3048491 RepID=A0ABT7EK04_9GAMM|nr:hypothetical protein [Pseudoalteromonas sp. P94(2023)]MDK2595370.1 hypothetical protein [Pseudoalteromonas sp. P94(2023)]
MMQEKLDIQFKSLKRYKLSFSLLVVTLLLNLITLVLFVNGSDKFVGFTDYIKVSYMAFFTVLYAYFIYSWKNKPLFIVTPLLAMSLLQIVTVKWQQWSFGLNPFSVIGLSLNFDTVSISVNLLAIVMVGLAWQCRVFRHKAYIG